MTVIPKTLANVLVERETISFCGCLAQSYFYFLLGISEYILLAVMSHDQYIAVCYPLHYNLIMTGRFCIWLVAGSWLGGFFSTLVPTVMKLRLPYCGPNINLFFVIVPPLLHLACTDTRLVEFIDFIISLPALLGSLLLTIISYFFIICAIICIPTDKGKQKAFSTCSVISLWPPLAMAPLSSFMSGLHKLVQ